MAGGAGASSQQHSQQGPEPSQQPGQPDADMNLQGRCLSTLGAACGLNGSACRLCQRRTATDAELISQPLRLCITLSLLNCCQAVVGGAGLGSEQQPQQATEPSQQGQQGAPLIVRGASTWAVVCAALGWQKCTLQRSAWCHCQSVILTLSL